MLYVSGLATEASRGAWTATAGENVSNMLLMPFLLQLLQVWAQKKVCDKRKEKKKPLKNIIQRKKRDLNLAEMSDVEASVSGRPIKIQFNFCLYSY